MPAHRLSGTRPSRSWMRSTTRVMSLTTLFVILTSRGDSSTSMPTVAAKTPFPDALAIASRSSLYDPARPLEILQVRVNAAASMAVWFLAACLAACGSQPVSHLQKLHPIDAGDVGTRAAAAPERPGRSAAEALPAGPAATHPG